MAQSTISQRIALEGAEDVLRQLASLGQAGEQAVKQIQAATSGANPALSGFSNIAETVRNAFGRIGEAIAPVRERFGEFGEAAALVGERLTKTAEILGIGLAAGLAGGVAGLLELIKHSAESAHQLEIQAGVLGLTVEQLQTYRAVAAQAGVDGDKLFTGLSRLAANVGKEQEKLTDDVLKLFEMLPAAASQAGVAVARGFQPAGDGIKSHIIANIQTAIPAIDRLIEVFKTAANEQGVLINPQALFGFRQNLLNSANDATKLGEEIRKVADIAGVKLPSQTIAEQIARGAATAKDPLLALGVSLKDIQDAGANLDPIFRKIVDGLRALPSPFEQGRIGSALLGRGWRDLVGAFDGGSQSIDRVRKALEDTGLLLHEQAVGSLAELGKTFFQLQDTGKRLQDQLTLIFAPSLNELVASFTQFVKDNAAVLLAWARAISNEVLPNVQKLIGQFKGAGDEAKKFTTSAAPAAEVLSGGGAGRGVTAGAVGPAATAEAAVPQIDTTRLDEIMGKIERFKAQVEGLRDTFSTVFTLINIGLTGLAVALNTAFGTNLDATGAAAVLVIGRITGAFALATAAVRTLLSLEAGLLGLFGIGAGPLALINALIILGALIVTNHDKITKFVEDSQKSLGDFLQSNIGDRINSLFAGINFDPLRQSIIGAIETGVQSLDNFLQIIANFFEKTLPELVAIGVNAAFNSLKGLFDTVTSLLGKIASLAGFAAGGAPPAAAGAPTGAGDVGDLGISASGLASGGIAGSGPFARGPIGTDTIPAWLTPGEFVMSARAVRHYGTSLLHAFNSLAVPFDPRGFSLGGLVDALGDALMPRAPLMLASGGAAVAAGGSPTHVLNLTIGNEQFGGLMAPGAVYDRLARHARASAVRSAGRKPSWYS